MFLIFLALILLINLCNLYAADASSTLNRFYHTGSLALAVLAPVAFALPSSPLSMPLDVAISLLVPYHSHVAMNYVVTDYVPKASRPLVRGVVLATSIIAAAGLLKLTFHGPGVVETVKGLWDKPEKK